MQMVLHQKVGTAVVADHASFTSLYTLASNEDAVVRVVQLPPVDPNKYGKYTWVNIRNGDLLDGALLAYTLLVGDQVILTQ